MLENLYNGLWNYLMGFFYWLYDFNSYGPLSPQLRFAFARLSASLVLPLIAFFVVKGMFWFGGYFWEYLISQFKYWLVSLKEQKATHKIKNQIKSLEFVVYDYLLVLKEFLARPTFHDHTFIGLEAGRFFRHFMTISDLDRMKHLQVIGMTGTGKTTGVFLPLFLQDAIKDRPVIFIDPKGEWSTISAIEQIAQDVGRPENLLMFSLSYPEYSCTYNPLLAGDCDTDVIIDAFLNNFDNENTYYRDVAKTIFKLGYKILHCLEKPFTIMDTYAYLNNEDCFNQINKLAASTNRQSLEYLLLMDEEIRKLNAQHKNWRVCLIGFNNYLLSFNHPLFNEADSDIVLSDCIKEKKLVYFQLPTNAYPMQARRIGRMLQANIRYVSSLIQTNKLIVDGPVSVIIDEYGSFADQEFVEVLNKARSSGMMVTLGHQSLSDLTAISESFMKQIDENTLNKIILKQSDPKLCEHISKSIGTFQKAGRTYKEGKGDFGNQILTGEASLRFENEFILHPDKIKNLNSYGQGYYISRADNRFKCVNISSLKFDARTSFTKNTKQQKQEGLNLYKKFYLDEVNKTRVKTNGSQVEKWF